MRKLFLLIISSLCSCSISNYSVQNKEVTYIFFNNDSSKTATYYSGKDPITGKYIGGLKYLYELENGSIIFETKTDSQDNFQLPISKANKLDIKTMDWLSENTNKGLEYYAYKLLSKKHNVYIVLEDSIHKKLNFIDVIYIQEIE